MSAFAQVVSVGTSPTLIFEVVDGVTYEEQGYSRASNPTIFKSGDDNAPLPLLLIFPPTTDIFLGGSTVTATGAGVGANINGLPSLAYNCVGGDSLYGIVGSSTANIQILALRQ